MDNRKPSKAELRARTNATESALPTGELADALVMLEEARGIVECIGLMADVNVDVTGLRLEEVVRSMGSAAEGAARLVAQAEAFLIEAKEVEARRG